MAVKAQAKDGSDNVYFENWDREWTLIGSDTSSVIFSSSNWNELYINVVPYYYNGSGQMVFSQMCCDFYIPTALIDDTSYSTAKDYTSGFGSGYHSNSSGSYEPGMEVIIRITTNGVYLVSFYWVDSRNPDYTRSTSLTAYLRVFGR